MYRGKIRTAMIAKFFCDFDGFPEQPDQAKRLRIGSKGNFSRPLLSKTSARNLLGANGEGFGLFLDQLGRVQ
jgi:hypothetical protein